MINAKKEADLYTACGMYRGAYDKLAMVLHAISDAPNTETSRKMRADAVKSFLKAKDELRKALDESFITENENE